ncbi:hypothetical protein [Zhongshania sp.]|uniref:hypothetical protein n=1 Tax=Zhongshania sp. TaxID=1971902 RepID=UPI00356311FA
MKLNVSVCCDKCACTTHCQLALFNRPQQPWTFRCAACDAQIDITMVASADRSKVITKVKGAGKLDERWF